MSDSTYRRLGLPPRTGDRPRTGDAVPHLHRTQKSPRHVRAALLEWAGAALPGVSLRASLVSVPSTVALWLDESVPAAPGARFMPPPGSREFAHVHGDGSMHLCLPERTEHELFEGGWGEPHPLRERGVREVLAYAPRDEGELALSEALLAESYRYATGGEPDGLARPQKNTEKPAQHETRERSQTR